MTRMLLVTLLFCGCRSSRGNDRVPFVQFSSDAPADYTVTITRRGHFSPPCLAIDVAQTVEWYNPHGGAINVTSASVRGAPPELFSPSLVGSAERWRHTFFSPGRIDYFDQNGGAGAIDPYYGTRTTGALGGAAGTICVRRADGSGCDALCCREGAGVTQCGGGGCDLVADDEVSVGFCAEGTTAPLDAATD